MGQHPLYNRVIKSKGSDEDDPQSVTDDAETAQQIPDKPNQPDDPAFSDAEPGADRDWDGYLSVLRRAEFSSNFVAKEAEKNA